MSFIHHNGTVIEAFQLSTLIRHQQPLQRSQVNIPAHPSTTSLTSSRRLSSSSTFEKQETLVPFLRRDASLVNVASETESLNGGEGRILQSTTVDGTGEDKSIHDDDDDDDDTSFRGNISDENKNESNDPVCRVVATSDGKVQPTSAYASLSPSSQELNHKLELLYTVQSKMQLRDLAYVAPKSSTDIQTTANFTASDDSQEQQLVSVLKQSLQDGGFRLMDERDLDLCSALNAGYLLRLSLLPDLKYLDPCIGKEFYPELYDEDESPEVGKESNNKQTKKLKPHNKKLLFDGRVLVFRRGYSQEVTTGRLLLPKLDYLQASLVQRSSAMLTRQLGVLEQRLEDIIFGIVIQINNIIRRWFCCLLQWTHSLLLGIVEDLGVAEKRLVSGMISENNFLGLSMNNTADELDTSNLASSSMGKTNNEFRIRGNKIFKLARYGVGESYSTSDFIANSVDLSDALSPFLLCEVGTTNDTVSIEQDMYDGIDAGKVRCQYDDAFHSSEDSSSSAVRLLERVSIQNTVNFFSKKGRRDLVKNYFKKSTLMEPSYEEVVVVWRPMRNKKRHTVQSNWVDPVKRWLYNAAKIFDIEEQWPSLKPDEQIKTDIEADVSDGPLPLEIKAFYDVPMANILAVLPKTKLVFRQADAFVFDLVSVVSFLAVVGSVKFDSPRLDLIAFVALGSLAVRTFFRYSNKYARYDLLVNKFLTQKISHRGPGALKYLISEANSQRALRAMLARDWLSESDLMVEKRSDLDGTSLDELILEQGKAYTNNKASTNAARVDVDIRSAVEELDNLGLITKDSEYDDLHSFNFDVKEETEANETIKRRWSDLLD